MTQRPLFEGAHPKPLPPIEEERVRYPPCDRCELDQPGDHTCPDGTKVRDLTSREDR